MKDPEPSVFQDFAESVMQRWITKLPQRVRWAPHNLVAHPTMEVLFWFGKEQFGNWLHNATVPEDL